MSDQQHHPSPTRALFTRLTVVCPSLTHSSQRPRLSFEFDIFISSSLHTQIVTPISYISTIYSRVSHFASVRYTAHIPNFFALSLNCDFFSRLYPSASLLSILFAFLSFHFFYISKPQQEEPMLY
ncbi:uncharacterized protein BDW43DRAFT_101588 [Aspergillus alliaceus]|uniref:uncharacterized protein n=1 Tax=Petromyces alliaceus TaxID=209559 RepID=UPI0012A45032|nr:uncharacterized protein BDW43DRAFT_101588 [Aspergillus alliaceus]KAB8232694.1 hypothetical protein BDW43DRAFT_101588 [Aspergillus alliaceus]